MICATCGRENAADARFCSSCGAALATGPAEDVTRKVVTVVFTDVVGSTALGERLDPETLRRVMWRYFDAAQRTFERHGGTVEKFVGDAVMAVFGVPSVHEDDALRAVRAVVELRERLESLNAELEREHGVRIVTRTGINTGEVIVGGDAADQKLATGDAVNVAARLEQAAEPGAVLVGEATHAIVRAAVVAEPAPPVDAKGKSEPLAAWRVLGVRPDVPAFARPIATPFVGRTHELAALRNVFERAVRERSCELATVVGTPGIGKSRLAREAISLLEREARVLVGRCAAYGHGIPYLPLADIVRDVAGDEPESGLAALLAGHERGGLAARLVAGAVGARAEPGSPDETAWAFRRLFETLAAQRPLVVAVDDIHWADPALLDLLEYVVGFSTGAPVVLLCLARPDLFDVRASWATPRPRTTLVSLDPLPERDAERLLDELPHDGELPAAVRRRIVERAEGNPLFVEQMAAMLAEDPHAADGGVPPTIQALVAARLDRLEPNERAVAQRAAVEGRLFHRSALGALLADGGDLGGTLLALARKEFVRPDRALLPGDDAFRFNHVLIRDVAYASLPKELRADLHARLADWLLDRAAPGLTGRDELVGYHLEQAYRHRVELGRSDEETAELGARAGRVLGAAGRRALDRGESGSAASLLERAARLLEARPGERAGLLADLGRAHHLAGALDAADAALAEAIDQARRYGDERAACSAEIEQARVAFMRAPQDPEAIRAIARRAIEVFSTAGSDADLADAWQLMGIAELAARDRGAQLAALQQGRRHAIASGDVRRQIDAWNEVGGSMLFGRTPVVEVLAFLDEELAWAQERRLPAVEADALLGGPYLLSRLGQFDEGRRRLERSKAICRDLGIAYGLAEAHMAGAALEMLAGDPAAAERELRAAVEVATGMGASRYVALYRTLLARALVAQGRDDDALTELERSRGMYGDAPAWKSARARVLARRGALVDAVDGARSAVAAMAGSDDITAHAEALEALAEVLRDVGDPAGAADALREAIALHAEKGNLVNAERCGERLAALAG